MRSRIRLSTAAAILLLLEVAPVRASGPILLMGDEPGSWTKILSSVGLNLTQGAHVPPTTLREQVESGALAIVEGASSHAEEFGIVATGRAVRVRSVVDRHRPKLPIIWEKTVEIPVFKLPASATVFTHERWTGAPVVAGVKAGSGAVLWVAARPGEQGYERFPYILQAAADLGFGPQLSSSRLWAFFDGAYRSRVDLDYFAERWRNAGISALHIAAWHYFEQDSERDAWVRRLIDACHRRGILVYAWLELPHVSETFWADHPLWREKTALLQDAQLDWRKLMNLSDPDCFRAVSAGVRTLVSRFDWDGVNLAELYFESLEGAANPARFTPMNDKIRDEYRQLTGTDPLMFFQSQPAPEALASFLQYRAAIARRMQTQWIRVVEECRREKPHLDLTLTHVDDRYDPAMRDLIGADAGRVLPLLNDVDFTFLIEDPATVWHLGPDRYPQIAERYKAITPRPEKLAIDINIVERYQDVYPTKQQTGVELFQLVHVAASAFPRVALYFENSIMPVDQPLLPAAAAAASRFERQGDKAVVDSPRGLGVRWTSPPRVDGQEWPVWDGQVAWLPAGAHVIEPGTRSDGLRLLSFNGDLRNAAVYGRAIEVSYQSSARVFARTNRRPTGIEIDGEPAPLEWVGAGVLTLPRGQHVVRLTE